ncbi:MAG: hypothetical protein KGL61_12660 [Burkholderiales bacterium]|nr:hypothetical protein [Burkholderiales bacterium]MDE2610424.1 hypothetical protein [Burkholderiales bacterium]
MPDISNSALGRDNIFEKASGKIAREIIIFLAKGLIFFSLVLKFDGYIFLRLLKPVEFALTVRRVKRGICRDAGERAPDKKACISMGIAVLLVY